MKPNHHPIRLCVAFGAALLSFTAASAWAQLTPGQIQEIQNTAGDRIEAATILGGDFGMSGASFYRGDNSVSVSKFGGAGDVGDPQPLGNTGIGWQPRLQGSMGYLSFKNELKGELDGAESKIQTFAIQFGGGARFWFNDQLSVAPTIMGMYGHTKNEFNNGSSTNAPGIADEAKQLGLIEWNVDTWTIRPAMNLQYLLTFDRTIVTLSSDFAYFHTESFSSTSSLINVNGDSETWQNKIDVDVPLGKQLFGHELRTGGYFSRTELYDNIKEGMNLDHIYEIHGRVVLDYLGQLWKVQWIGIGGSYLWGNGGFNGWSVGADIAFRF